eukprot:TRINITY_DN3231_c0_g1_i14.p1 TRINITY_DN3231_c0_g1~~TRINITY_DN3231_c0_g1_i14.p1  ORF type:complete len:172 (+),score=41.50 TRINITY_DN3231_c0_g1_i14:804-1319(+)
MYPVSLKHGIHNCKNKEEAPKGSKEAVTDFKIVSYSPSLDCTILKCYPRTGRTHQIRVHLKSIGHPIENDKVYRTIHEASKELEEWKAKPKEERIIKLSEESKGLPFDIEDGCVIPCLINESFDEIYLHAYKYRFGKYKFKTTLPAWTNIPDPTYAKSKEDAKEKAKKESD